MGEEQSKNQLKSLAITTIVVAFTISAIWAWIWNDTKQQNHLTFRSYLDRIEALERQLHQRSLHEQDLLDRYSKASDLRTSLENNLTAITTKLEYLQEDLNDYQLGDWERKYLAEKSSNDQIFTTMAQLEEEIELLTEMQEVLILDHQETLEAERNKYVEHIATLKTELATSAKENRKLKKQPAPIVKQTKSAAPTDYRSARLISLMNNINGQSSQNKLDILVKVIPTVPEGISIHELTALTSNMTGGDILSLIQSTVQSIHKTNDKKSIRPLLSKMNKADADTASKLLIK